MLGYLFCTAVPARSQLAACSKSTSWSHAQSLAIESEVGLSVIKERRRKNSNKTVCFLIKLKS